MPVHLSAPLERAVAFEFVNLSALTAEQAAEHPQDAGWSRKEEVGHLIDSAVNNHIRFARASLDGEYSGPGYDQDAWVAAHGYHELPWPSLLDTWRYHNSLLVELVKRIPEDRLAAPCVIGGASPVTLRFVIEDYLLHMQHHLDHILSREKITQYPGAARR